jgi:SnoaL-like protein
LTDNEETGRTPAEVVLEFYAALRDRRIGDILAVADPEISCFPLLRPGLSEYFGHDGMIRLSEDMHAAHGQYDFTADKVVEDGDKVTVYARILPEPGLGQEDLPITSVYTLRNGLILAIESQPGISERQFSPQPPA